MAIKVALTQTITSAVANAVNGEWIRGDGQAFDVQIVAPAALVEIQVSEDRNTPNIATDLGAANMTALGNVYRSARERPGWVRAIVAADAGGPRNFVVTIGFIKELV